MSYKLKPTVDWTDCQLLQLINFHQNRHILVPADEDPLVNIVGEVWRSIPETAGVYQVSNKGRVRKSWLTKLGVQTVTILKPEISSSGFTRIEYRTGVGRRVKESLAKLVWRTFKKSPYQTLVHKDADKSNCIITNLLSLNKEEYSEYLKANKVRKQRKLLTDDEMIVIRRLLSLGLSQHDAAVMFDVADSTISKLLNNTK